MAYDPSSVTAVRLPMESVVAVMRAFVSVVLRKIGAFAPMPETLPSSAEAKMRMRFSSVSAFVSASTESTVCITKVYGSLPAAYPPTVTCPVTLPTAPVTLATLPPTAVTPAEMSDGTIWMRKLPSLVPTEHCMDTCRTAFANTAFGMPIS